MNFSFENLDVWNIAIDFAEKIYSISRDFPKNELYGITSQIRRASLSISVNIAEGKGRYSNNEFKQFLLISRGSLYESITLLKMCLRLKYISEVQYNNMMKDCATIQSKIGGLLSYLKSKSNA